MATVTINGTMTLDESAGLQTGGVATTNEDNNDSDVALSALQTDASSFYTRLFTGLALDSSFATANGVARSASDFISVNSGGSAITALGFVDGSGAALPVYGVASDGAVTSLVAVDGGAIELYADSASGLGNRMVLGVDQDGDIVFAAYMAPNGGLTAATVWMVQFEAMANPNTGSHDESVDLFDSIGVGVSSTTDFNFNTLPSGQNLFGMVGTASSAVVVVGALPVLKADGTFTNTSDTINTSKGGGPVTIGIDNQMFDPGDGAYFTFVTNPDSRYLAGAPGGLDQNEADDADNIQFGERLEVSGGYLKVSQAQGNGAIALKLTLFNQTEGAADLVDGRPLVTGGLGAGSHVAVTGITVLNAAGVNVTGSVSITLNGDGSATVSGIASGYKVLWTGVGVHDQILVEGISGKFDIGGMGVDQPNLTSIDIGDQLNFEDDGPTVSLSVKGGVELRVDESLGANGGGESEVPPSLGKATIAAADLFDSIKNFGTDGEGSAPLSYSLVLTGGVGADSGIDDTATGANVLLYYDGNDVVGRAGSAAGAIVFRISINAATGATSLDQLRAVVHGDPGDPDEADTPESINAGMVAARLTVHDGDGDSAHGDADIGPAMKFEDDGPSATLDLKLGAEVRVDESLGQNPGENEVGSLGSATVAAAVLFDKTTAFGQDGPGASSQAWSLVLSSAGADSGLDDSATGSNILLYNDGADIVGRVGSAAGAIDFRIAINATTGAVTLTQYGGMKHGDPTDPDEADTPLSLSAALVAARLTITDGDGDSAHDDADIGPAMKFEDDGPSAMLDLKLGAEVRVDESLGANAGENEVGSLGSVTVAAAVLFDKTTAFGQDGPGASSQAWSLVLSSAGADSGLDDSATGSNILLYNSGADIVGRVGSAAGAIDFRIAINATTGAVTLTQYGGMKHGDPTDPDEADTPLSLSAALVAARLTITDGDGDSAHDDADIGPAMKFEDDGPSATLDLKAGAEVRVDESLGQNPGENEVGSLGSVTVAAAVLFDKTTAFGQDGPGASSQAWSLALSSAGADSGLDDSATGSNILLYNDGADIVGRVGSAIGAIDFRIAINATTGAVTLTQYGGMKHGDPTDPDEADTPLSLSAALVAARLTITDGDGDSAHDDADIGPAMKFEDDGPSATLDLKLGAEVRVDESLGQNPGENEVGSLGSVTVAAATLFDKTTAFGQDGPGTSALSYSLLLSSAGVDSGMDDTATGSNVLLYNDGADIVGRVGSAIGAIDYRISINVTTGALTLTQYGGMKHGDPTDPDEADTALSLPASLVTARLTVTDGDGDSAHDDADIGPILKFEDNGPAVGPINDGLVDFVSGDSVTNSLNGDIGADAKTGPYTITAFTGSVSLGTFDVHGIINGAATQVSYWADTGANGIFGDAGDTEFYRLSLDQAGAGTYTFEVLSAPQPPRVFSFDALPSGQNLFGIVGDVDEGLVVIGAAPILKSAGNDSYANASDTINTSQGGGGITIGIDNQMFDPGDGAYFTFVHDPDPRYLAGVVGGLDQNEADRAGNIQFDGRTEVGGAFLGISQIQGNSLAELKLKAFDGNDALEGRTFVEGGGLGGGTVEAITQIVVKNAGGTIVQTINAPTADADGFYHVAGLDSGYRVEWTTVNPHDQVLVMGVSGKFDIGKFGTLQAAQIPDQVFDFTVQATDGDSDHSSSSFSIGVDGTGIYDDGAVGGVSALAFASILTPQTDLSVDQLGKAWLMHEPLF